LNTMVNLGESDYELHRYNHILVVECGTSSLYHLLILILAGHVCTLARLAGERFNELDDLVSTGDSSTSLFERSKLWMVDHFKNFGFFTILLFASVSSMPFCNTKL
jgi:hypothetical protein